MAEEERSVSQILADVMAHQMDNPRHGLNCACMDSFIREMRKLLHASPVNLEDGAARYSGSLNQFFESDEYRGFRRWEYILDSVVRGMHR